MATANLKGKITMDDSSFQRGLRRSGDLAQRTSQKMSAGFRAVGSAFAKIFVGGAAIRGISSVVGYVDDLDRKALQLGTTIQQIQGLEFVSSQNKTDIAATSKALFRMDRILGDLGNNRLAEAAFKNLNINIAQFRGLDPTERLAALSDALLNSADRGRAMADIYNILGRQGEALIPILSQGSSAILQQAASVDKLSAAQARSLVIANDAWDRLWKNIKTGAAESIGSVAGLGEYAADVFKNGFEQADLNLANRIEEATVKAEKQRKMQEAFMKKAEELEKNADNALNLSDSVSSRLPAATIPGSSQNLSAIGQLNLKAAGGRKDETVTVQRGILKASTDLLDRFDDMQKMLRQGIAPGGVN